MAVAVYITNTTDATEVCIDGSADKEIAIVGYNYPDAVPVRIVGAVLPNVLHTKIVNSRFIVLGETLIPYYSGYPAILLESGGYMLLESGSRVLLES